LKLDSKIFLPEILFFFGKAFWCNFVSVKKRLGRRSTADRASPDMSRVAPDGREEATVQEIAEPKTSNGLMSAGHGLAGAVSSAGSSLATKTMAYALNFSVRVEMRSLALAV
jgi:hypothetical protein